jgi:hypothetical protein
MYNIGVGIVLRAFVCLSREQYSHDCRIGTGSDGFRANREAWIIRRKRKSTPGSIFGVSNLHPSEGVSFDVGIAVFYFRQEGGNEFEV